MHMSDALLSPVVGGTFWAISGSLIAYSAKKIHAEHDPAKTPLMGVMGAFVFAAQMINFSIPGTGSSGHIGGGLLLTIVLGPYRAFIALTSVLIIQSLFFADGGLLALGCNIFNLAFFPAFIAYPFIYRLIVGTTSTPKKLALGSISAATVGLLMGAFSVVLQTTFSSITELPFTTFLLFMLPIHLAIGIVEGLITWAVLSFLVQTSPHLLEAQTPSTTPRFALAFFTIAALLTAGLLSWIASSHPDGLEWSIAKVTGKEELSISSNPLHTAVATVQNTLAFLPDYNFKESAPSSVIRNTSEQVGTSVAGIVGTVAVLATAGMAGFVLSRKRKAALH